MLAEAPTEALAGDPPMKPGEEERSRLLAKTCIVEAFRKLDTDGGGLAPRTAFLHVVCLLFYPLSEKDACRLLLASGALDGNDGQSVNYMAFTEWIMAVPATPRAQLPAAPPTAAAPQPAAPAPEESGDLELSLSKPLSETSWARPGTGELGGTTALAALEEEEEQPSAPLKSSPPARAEPTVAAHDPRGEFEEQSSAPLKASPPPAQAAVAAQKVREVAAREPPSAGARHFAYEPEEDAAAGEFDPASSAARIDRIFNFMLKEWDQESEVPDAALEAEQTLRGPPGAYDGVEVQPAPLAEQKATPQPRRQADDGVEILAQPLVQQKAPPPRQAPDPAAPQAPAPAMNPAPGQEEAEAPGPAENEAGDNLSAALRLTHMLKEELISTPEGEWAGRLQGSSRAELGKLLELLSSPSARDLVDLLNGQGAIPPPVTSAVAP